MCIFNMNKTLYKKCHVCGDLASGFNYNALTCDSCKVFFNRNSPKYRALVCKRTGKCAVDKLNRRDCSKCRMEKCFLVGMKRASVEFNYSAEQAIVKGIEQFLGMSSLKRIDKCDLTKMAQYMARFPKNREIVKLNSYELERINDANNAISVFPDEQNCKIVAIIRSKEELNLLENDSQFQLYSNFYIRKTINFCQNFAVFNDLKQDDQMILLKPCYFEIMMLRLSFRGSAGLDYVPLIMDEVGTHAIGLHVDFAKQMTHQDVLALGGQMGVGLRQEMDNDFIIRDLLSAMCLFKNHHSISCPEVVRYHYFLYTQLLVRYLEIKYQSKKEAKRKFHKLINLLEDMNLYLGFKHKLIEDFDSSTFPTIFKELYDLE